MQLISDSKESVTIHVHGTSDGGVQLEMLMFGSIHLVFHRLGTHPPLTTFSTRASHIVDIVSRNWMMRLSLLWLSVFFLSMYLGRNCVDSKDPSVSDLW